MTFIVYFQVDDHSDQVQIYGADPDEVRKNIEEYFNNRGLSVEKNYTGSELVEE